MEASKEGSRAVYRVASGAASTSALYASATDGSGTVKLLDEPSRFHVLEPRGARSVVLGHTADGAMFALYAVEIGEGGAVGSVQLEEGGSYFPLLVTPGGDRVLYRDLEDASGSARLYAVPVNGGSAVQLDLTLPELEPNDLTDGHFIPK